MNRFVLCILGGMCLSGSVKLIELALHGRTYCGTLAGVMIGVAVFLWDTARRE